jgi:multidrug efflux pump subunit AcrA (membrane-fusion protein)
VARQRAVKLGEIVGNDYAVLEGVQPGDHVIVSGTQFLQDGAPVTEQLKEVGKTGESEKSSGAKSN